MTQRATNRRRAGNLKLLCNDGSRSDMVEWIANCDYLHAITLTIDSDVELLKMVDMCGRFFLEIDR